MARSPRRQWPGTDCRAPMRHDNAWRIDIARLTPLVSSQSIHPVHPLFIPFILSKQFGLAPTNCFDRIIRMNRIDRMNAL